MGLSDLFKKPQAPKSEPVVGDISGLFKKALAKTPPPPSDGGGNLSGLFDTKSSPEDKPTTKTAKLSLESMQFRESKPYLALIGQTFDVWGVVDVVGDTRAHIAAKNVPESILKRTGSEKVEEPVAFERKLVLATTKAFHDLPRETALEGLNTLAENLECFVDEMKERIESAVPDYKDEPKVHWKEFLREIEKEFKEYWAEDLARFKDEELPQAAADYWEEKRDEYQALAEEAEAARVRSLAKIRKPS